MKLHRSFITKVRRNYLQIGGEDRQLQSKLSTEVEIN